MNQQRRFILSVLLIGLVIFTTLTAPASGTDVTLRWDPNEPVPEGYRVFVREDGQSYNYDHPLWENSQTACTLIGLVEGVTYHFVVRAFDGQLESTDSEEVSYTSSAIVPNQRSVPNAERNRMIYEDAVVRLDGSLSIDTDGDNVPDVLDSFPTDSAEWADNDNDGLGDNQDPDDDNDGMTDVWETAHGLDPLQNDTGLDENGDGVLNIDEFRSNSDSSTASDNSAPDAPIVDAAIQTARVSLTPVLMVEAPYVDLDNDDHFKSQWQISTDTDFTTLILDKTSKYQLTAYDVGNMLLDLDTVYYWRVRFIDSRNAVSEWSATATFTTVAPENSADQDLNGIPDEQEVGAAVDVNENGVCDAAEDTIMSVNTVEGQTIVGVETHSTNVSLVALESLPSAAVPDKSVKMRFGLVGFKLCLVDGVTPATVTIHFATPVPNNTKLYKYAPETGWQVYEPAFFAANR